MSDLLTALLGLGVYLLGLHFLLTKFLPGPYSLGRKTVQRTAKVSGRCTTRLSRLWWGSVKTQYGRRGWLFALWHGVFVLSIPVMALLWWYGASLPYFLIWGIVCIASWSGIKRVKQRKAKRYRLPGRRRR